jgi:adenosylcobinamide-phosphate synthase
MAAMGCSSLRDARGRHAVKDRCQALLLALAADMLVGELPNQVHPVVMMGRWLSLGERLAPTGEHSRLVWGTGWLLGGVGISAGLAARIPHHPLVQGLLASTLLAYGALERAVAAVETALSNGDLPEARRLLGWHLVSRPTENLNESEVAAAAIESLAENLSDSIIAPMYWYVLGGLPALAAYRFTNTADAMWGYHNARYEYLGKTAARCDDLLNWAPARLAAALIALAAQWTNACGVNAWRVARRDHVRTASPNAGWPMAAMAGALDTVLLKLGYYRLGDGTRQPDAAMITIARQIARRVLIITVGLMMIGVTR